MTVFPSQKAQSKLLHNSAKALSRQEIRWHDSGRMSQGQYA
jgi:hypothetical protein